MSGLSYKEIKKIVKTRCSYQSKQTEWNMIKTLRHYTWCLGTDYIESNITSVIEFLDRYPDRFPLTDKLYNMLAKLRPYITRKYDRFEDIKHVAVFKFCIDLGYTGDFYLKANLVDDKNEYVFIRSGALNTSQFAVYLTLYQKYRYTQRYIITT
jgi:hypothetical protein